MILLCGYCWVKYLLKDSTLVAAACSGVTLLFHNVGTLKKNVFLTEESLAIGSSSWCFGPTRTSLHVLLGLT